MHFQAHMAILTGLCALATASPFGWYRDYFPAKHSQNGVSSRNDKREAHRYGNPRNHVVTTSVPSVTSVPRRTAVRSITLGPFFTPNPNIPPPKPLIPFAPLVGFNGDQTCQFLDDETCIVIGVAPPQKRSVPDTKNDTESTGTKNDTESTDTKNDTANSNDEEVPLRTTWVNYIKVFIYSLGGQKCPGTALLQPPLSDDNALRERSAQLTKRQPQTLDELFKLFVSVYNECPEVGYR